jgi:transcriptional repressor NrdR
MVESSVRRRRECEHCGLRFTTYERVQRAALMVAKRDGRREEFNREKLRAGLVKACTKRPVSTGQIERVVEEIETQLQALGKAEVPSTVVGELVMDKLKQLDRVAYVRFASVYRGFQDIESFERVVNDLKKEGPVTEQLPLLEGVPLPTRTTRRPRRPRPRTTVPIESRQVGTGTQSEGIPKSRDR